MADTMKMNLGYVASVKMHHLSAAARFAAVEAARKISEGCTRGRRVERSMLESKRRDIQAYVEINGDRFV